MLIIGLGLGIEKVIVFGSHRLSQLDCDNKSLMYMSHLKEFPGYGPKRFQEEKYPKIKGVSWPVYQMCLLSFTLLHYVIVLCLVRIKCQLHFG